MTTKNAYNIGRNEMGLWLNCKSCQSTMLMTDYDTQSNKLLKQFEDYRKLLKKAG